ncbi:hypothetical protein [Nocardia sp. NPDC051570]|uniref:hypothetical protein n=1 Tax=Nocardia sp. NPDC051570 TaxID=3364324 RepID=UPI0037957DB3
MRANEPARLLAEFGRGTEEPVEAAFGADILPIDVPAAIPEAHDRLVRHLFDIGLQLHAVRTVFEDTGASPEQIRAAGDRVLSVLDDLDLLIRDAGLTMLDLAVRRDPPPNRLRPNGNGRRRRA